MKSSTWRSSDNLGTVRDLAEYDEGMDETTVVDHYVYDAFGNETDHTGSNDFLFKYTGRLFDDETGLQNNLNRWYDPAVGRWLSEDPIGFAAGDANSYRYVENFATGATDPSGLQPPSSPYTPQRLPFVPRFPSWSEADDLQRKGGHRNADGSITWSCVPRFGPSIGPKRPPGWSNLTAAEQDRWVEISGDSFSEDNFNRFVARQKEIQKALHKFSHDGVDNTGKEYNDSKEWTEAANALGGRSEAFYRDPKWIQNVRAEYEQSWSQGIKSFFEIQPPQDGDKGPGDMRADMEKRRSERFVRRVEERAEEIGKLRSKMMSSDECP